jgi:hypothetical protein
MLIDEFGSASYGGGVFRNLLLKETREIGCRWGLPVRAI